MLPKITGKVLYQEYISIFPTHEDPSVSSVGTQVMNVAKGLEDSASAFEKLPVELRDGFSLDKPLPPSFCAPVSTGPLPLTPLSAKPSTPVGRSPTDRAIARGRSALHSGQTRATRRQQPNITTAATAAAASGSRPAAGGRRAKQAGREPIRRARVRRPAQSHALSL